MEGSAYSLGVDCGGSVRAYKRRVFIGYVFCGVVSEAEKCRRFVSSSDKVLMVANYCQGCHESLLQTMPEKRIESNSIWIL
jgi:hypothetical protein